MSRNVPGVMFDRLRLAAEAGLDIDEILDGKQSTAQATATVPRRKARAKEEAPSLPPYDPPSADGLWRADRVSKGHQRAHEVREYRRDRLRTRWTVDLIIAAVEADLGMVEYPTFTRHVVNLFHLCGWMVDHGRAGGKGPGEMSTGTMGDEGPPDIKATRAGRLLIVELKREGEYLRGDQKLWRETLDYPGGPYRLWRPSNIRAIAADLD